jgi:hypothetical protein
MYIKAKAGHKEWIAEKAKLQKQMPKLKEIQLRMDPEYSIEKTENPTIHHIH